jgi:exodeoxyribonuclease VII small subunit
MTKNSKKLVTYKELTDKLDKNLAWFESDDIDLDSAVDKYQETIQQIEAMEAYLKTAQNKIKKIATKFDS